MSSTNDTSLCKTCQWIIEEISELDIAQIIQARNGIVIRPRGVQFIYGTRPLSTNSCGLCEQLTLRKMNSVDLQKELRRPSEHLPLLDIMVLSTRLEIRAFSFLQHYDGISHTRLHTHPLNDSISITLVPEGFDALRHPDALKSLTWRCGHLVYKNLWQWDPNSLSPRIIARHFDPWIVKTWLRYCAEHHGKLCSHSAQMPFVIRLIDCTNRTIVLAPEAAQYVTLSYVWGQAKDQPTLSTLESKLDDGGTPLPVHLPQVVEDAIEVSLALGFQYLWVDKYCIEQSSAEKHSQIQQMGSIYSGSELTIIAAAGKDENTGLPGVGKSPRNQQPIFGNGPKRIISTMPHPHYTIKRSTWMTRGWTLQESVLSRRRLVFTEDQVYFECNAMNCSEALHVPLDNVHTAKKDHFRWFMRAGLFTGWDEGIENRIFGQPFGSTDELDLPWSHHFTKYLILATNYTSRQLTFDSDSLNAFSGVIDQLKYSRPPVLHLQGIPYIFSPFQTQDTTLLDFVIAGLCWRHVECCWTGKRDNRRRIEFPSWTWAGWAGTVSWTDLFTAEDMDIQSLVDDVFCEFEDGSVLDLRQDTIQQHMEHQHGARALRLTGWRIPPRLISLHGRETAPRWKIMMFNLDLHISSFGGTPSTFLEALRCGALQCVWIGKGLYNSYFLVLEHHGNSATRIGVGEIIFYNERGNCHRFADAVNEVRFEMSKIDVYLT